MKEEDKTRLEFFKRELDQLRTEQTYRKTVGRHLNPLLSDVTNLELKAAIQWYEVKTDEILADYEGVEQ